MLVICSNIEKKKKTTLYFVYTFPASSDLTPRCLGKVPYNKETTSDAVRKSFDCIDVTKPELRFSPLTAYLDLQRFESSNITNISCMDDP